MFCKITNTTSSPDSTLLEKSFAEQMNFLGLRLGGWAFYFWHQFRFSMCYPKGAYSLGHRLGQLPASGCKFDFPLCYPKGAHSFVRSPFGAISLKSHHSSNRYCTGLDEEDSFAPQMIFLGLRPGGWANYDLSI